MIKDIRLDRINIVDVIREVVELKRAGKEWRGLCPFHKETQPSFYVNEDKGVYYCFGCGAKGNVITFLKNYYKMNFWEAVKYLEQKFKIILLDDTNFEVNRVNSIHTIFDYAKKYYIEKLHTNSHIIDWLTNNKKLTLKQIEEYELGYEDNKYELLFKLKQLGFDLNIISQTGLFNNGESILFKRIIFPVYYNGKIIGFSGRGEGQPKYLHTKNFGLELYPKIFSSKLIGRNNEFVIIVEGFFDVIKLNVPSIALMGTNTNTRTLEYILHLTNKFYIALDKDAFALKPTSSILSLIKFFISNGIDQIYIFDYNTYSSVSEPEENPSLFENLNNYLYFIDYLKQEIKKMNLQQAKQVLNIIGELAIINQDIYNEFKNFLKDKYNDYLNVVNEIAVVLRLIKQNQFDIEILNSLSSQSRKIIEMYLDGSLFANPQLFSLFKQAMIIAGIEEL